MTNQLLPKVTVDTARAHAEGADDIGPRALTLWLEQMRAENPVLVSQIVHWVNGISTVDDPKYAYLLCGPALVYQLLRAQAEADTLAQRGTKS